MPDWSARIHKLVLDALGVKSVIVVGGSMGGMATLEWPLCTERGYVKTIIPIATSADHNAWGISWAEAQRQCIFADPAFEGGHYIPNPATQPSTGLAAARMVAMLTYRSCESFDTRFGRKPAAPKSKTASKAVLETSNPVSVGIAHPSIITELHSNMSNLSTKYKPESQGKTDPSFSAQSYLQYQGQKFISRFDANCYIHLTRKMDNHDVTRGRTNNLLAKMGVETDAAVVLSNIFCKIPSGALVIGIQSDVLFRPEQQDILAKTLPSATLVILASPEGHDGFLLEFEVLEKLIVENLRSRCPWIYDVEPFNVQEERVDVEGSVFGEVELGW